jgi:hypothetical protein
VKLPVPAPLDERKTLRDIRIRAFDGGSFPKQGSRGLRRLVRLLAVFGSLHQSNA